MFRQGEAMNRFHHDSRWFVITAVVATGSLLSACNVDGLWDKRPPRNAPTTSATDPGRVDLTRHKLDLEMVPGREVDLVETVLTHRALYHQSLERLRDYYAQHGEATKLKWAEFELKGARKVQPFRYLLDAEIAADSLRPTESIPEADAMYNRGLELMKEGGHGMPVFYRQDLMLQAAGVFREMVEKYPSSDKIDDAAFMLGEIHREYLPGQEAIAVKWYERAWTWDPHTPHPARYEAAIVFDYRLHDRDRALELYQAIMREETGDSSNSRFATRRISELTSSDRSASASGKE